MSEAIKSLSEREKETLRLLLAGHDAKSIARDLDLSVHTVNDRLREARRKLGVSSSREAARLLAQAEGENPKFLAPTNLGMAKKAIGTQQTVRTGPPTGINHRLWWLAGGLLVLLAIAAAALLSLNGAEGPPRLLNAHEPNKCSFVGAGHCGQRKPSPTLADADRPAKLVRKLGRGRNHIPLPDFGGWLGLCDCPSP
jgi:DNA-binding CsgD family transcriptional regulator